MTTTPTPSRLKKTGRLIVSDSERCADMLYAVGMFVPDSFIWAEIEGQPLVIVSPLEAGRMATGVKGNTTVYNVDEIMESWKLQDRKILTQLLGLSKHFAVGRWVVPYDFPLGLAESLDSHGISCAPEEKAFFPERECKTPAEINYLREGVQLAESGLLRGIEVLKEATIQGTDLIWQGSILTAEILRGEIDSHICKQGGIAAHTIVAPGPEGADPHNAGSGPIHPNEPIIIDIFPRVTATGYFGDLTRTVVKGQAPDIVKQAFEAVRDARDRAKAAIHANANGKEIHQTVAGILTDHGFETDLKSSPPKGFFHGTGHGLGLEIHEMPRISSVEHVLKAGHVVTIEPGVYYPEWGGVRLEDVVVVTSDGCEDLTSVPTLLEIDSWS